MVLILQLIVGLGFIWAMTALGVAGYNGTQKRRRRQPITRAEWFGIQCFEVGQVTAAAGMSAWLTMAAQSSGANS